MKLGEPLIVQGMTQGPVNSEPTTFPFLRLPNELQIKAFTYRFWRIQYQARVR